MWVKMGVLVWYKDDTTWHNSLATDRGPNSSSKPNPTIPDLYPNLECVRSIRTEVPQSWYYLYNIIGVLRVNFVENLSFKGHIMDKINKAYSMLGIIL